MDTKEMVDTKPLVKFVDNLGVDRIFGRPTKERDTVVIPVAQVTFGFGYGGGFSEGEAKVGNKGANVLKSDLGSAGGEGAGSGGGAGGKVTPRGYIRITPDEVKWEPIESTLLVPLAGIAMVAWMIFWVTATVRYIARVVARTKVQTQKRR